MRTSGKKPTNLLLSNIRHNNSKRITPLSHRVPHRPPKVGTPYSLKRLQSYSTLKNPSASLSTSVHNLRTENFQLKDSLLNLNIMLEEAITDKKQQSLIMMPSSSRNILEEEIQVKKKLLEQFEEQWNSVSSKYESLYDEHSSVGLKEKVITFEDTLQHIETQLNLDMSINPDFQIPTELQELRGQVEDLERSLKNCEEEKEKNQGIIEELESKMGDEFEERRPSKGALKKKADVIVNDHINQMKQLKWEEQRLKQGLEAILKSEKEVISQVEKKRLHFEKIKGQIDEMMNKKIRK